jgi:hypothetical protein
VTERVEFALEDGSTVLVEVDEAPRFERAGRVGDAVEQAAATFEQALTGVRNAASAALHQFRALPVRPDEVEISFGVKLDVEAGAVIARSGVEGQLGVRLKWRRAAHAGEDAEAAADAGDDAPVPDDEDEPA